jgi:ParB family chromosome partitioning protein
LKDNGNKEEKASAFKNVDALFEDTAPKDAAPENTAPKKEPEGKKDDTKSAAAKEADAKALAAEPAEKVRDELALVPPEAMHGFPDHPYTVDDADSDMAELVESIRREGLLERVVVRRRKEGGFEILSGHRRHRACQLLGIKEVPVIIKHGLTDDQAVLLMVDANLKRKNILPMDEARALKMQMDAMNRMGQRSTHGKLKRTDEIIAEKIEKNRMYVQRKVKLLDLEPDLQKAVNEGTLSETPAFEIAALPPKVQALFYDWMTLEDRSPTVAQAISLRQHQQELTKTGGADKKKGRLLTEGEIDRIMNGEKLASVYPPPPEPEKTEQAEKGDAAGPQAPAASGEKEGNPAAPVGAAAPEMPSYGPGGEGGAPPQPGASEEKAIPFQAPGTKAPEPGRASYNSAAPNPAVPAAEPPVSAEAATKSYIRTECMAELRKENVLLPKSELKEHLPNCSTNAEYVAAIKAALVEVQAKSVDVKAAEDKGNKGKPPYVPPFSVSTPTTEIVNRAEAREAAEKAAKIPTTPAPKAPEPVKVDAKAPAAPTPALGAPESPKVDGKAPATPTPAPKAPEPVKVDSKTPSVPTPAPKTLEPVKVDAKDVSDAKLRPTAIPLFKPTGKDSGTEALDNFLKNKAKPGKGKGQPEKPPVK